MQIIKRANDSGEDPLSLSARFSQFFLEDMAELQCAPPTDEPHVSDHIDQIKDMVTKVISRLVIRSSYYFEMIWPYTY